MTSETVLLDVAGIEWQDAAHFFSARSGQCVNASLTTSPNLHTPGLKLPVPKHTASLCLNLGGVLLETEIVLRNNFLCQEGCLPKHTRCALLTSWVMRVCRNNHLQNFSHYCNISSTYVYAIHTETPFISNNCTSLQVCHAHFWHLHPAPIAPKVCWRPAPAWNLPTDQLDPYLQTHAPLLLGLPTSFTYAALVPSVVLINFWTSKLPFHKYPYRSIPQLFLVSASFSRESVWKMCLFFRRAGIHARRSVQSLVDWRQRWPADPVSGVNKPLPVQSFGFFKYDPSMPFQNKAL